MVLKSGGQPSGQPHQLDIALRLPLQAAAGLDAVEIAVEVDLRQRRRMVGRPPGRRRLHALKADRRQVQLIDERLDDPNWIVLGHIIVQRSRQQERLPPVLILNETPLNRPSETIRFDQNLGRFHTAWIGRGRAAAEAKTSRVALHPHLGKRPNDATMWRSVAAAINALSDSSD